MTKAQADKIIYLLELILKYLSKPPKLAEFAPMSEYPNYLKEE